MELDDIADFHAPVLKHREVSLTSEGELRVKGETLFLGYVSESGILRQVDHLLNGR
jgi:hypothetical protein